MYRHKKEVHRQVKEQKREYYKQLKRQREAESQDTKEISYAKKLSKLIEGRNEY